VIEGDYCIAAHSADGRRIALKVDQPGTTAPRRRHVIKATTADGHIVGVALRQPTAEHENGISVVTADGKQALLVTEMVPKCLFKVRPGTGVVWSYPYSTIPGVATIDVAGTSDGGCVAIVNEGGYKLHKFFADGEISWTLANPIVARMRKCVQFQGAIYVVGNASSTVVPGDPTNVWKININTGDIEATWGLAASIMPSGAYLQYPSLRLGQSGGNYLAILGSGRRTYDASGATHRGQVRTHAVLDVDDGLTWLYCDYGTNSSNVTPAHSEVSSSSSGLWLTCTGAGDRWGAERYGWSSGNRYGLTGSGPETEVVCVWEGLKWGDPDTGYAGFHATDHKTVWQSGIGYTYYGWKGNQRSTHGIMLANGTLVMNSVESGVGTFWEKRATDTSLLLRSPDALTGVYSPSGPYLRTQNNKVLYCASDFSRVVEMDSGFANLWEWATGATMFTGQVQAMDYAADGDIYVGSTATTMYDRDGGTALE